MKVTPLHVALFSMTEKTPITFIGTNQLHTGQVQSIEREDGSGNCFIIHFEDKEWIFVRYNGDGGYR